MRFGVNLHHHTERTYEAALILLYSVVVTIRVKLYPDVVTSPIGVKRTRSREKLGMRFVALLGLHPLPTGSIETVAFIRPHSG